MYIIYIYIYIFLYMCWNKAATGTIDGDVVIWDLSLIAGCLLMGAVAGDRYVVLESGACDHRFPR